MLWSTDKWQNSFKICWGGESWCQGWITIVEVTHLLGGWLPVNVLIGIIILAIAFPIWIYKWTNFRLRNPFKKKRYGERFGYGKKD